MHEVSIAEEIKDIVLKKLKQNNGKKIKKINLQIGKLTSVMPDALLFAFDVISKNSPLENAEINIEMIDIKAKCEKCKKVFKVDEFTIECPFCKDMQINIISGKELLISTIELGG